jgi:Ca2+-dependent lipid-binding protein
VAKSLNPTFFEKFTLSLKEDYSKQNVKIVVKDYDRITKDDFLG